LVEGQNRQLFDLGHRDWDPLDSGSDCKLLCELAKFFGRDHMLYACSIEKLQSIRW